jgi:hypothetical protein
MKDPTRSFMADRRQGVRTEMLGKWYCMIIFCLLRDHIPNTIRYSFYVLYVR